jgi:DNA-binding NtrC family response regulator
VKARILVVEDERAIQIALSGLLRRQGYEVGVASTGEEAVSKLEETPVDLVLTDLALGRGISGMDVLRRAKELRPETLVVMITAHGSEAIAVEAMKAGAEDYVPKPFDNDEIRLVVQRALDRTRLERENRLLLEQLERQYGFDSLIGSGPAMRRVFETLQKVAETDLTVLVRGESGTGKELVAQALHARSPRRARPFVAVNCAAISRHRRRCTPPGPLRGRRRWNGLPRRDRRHGARDPGQGAAGAPGALPGAGGRHQADPGGRAGGGGHAPQPGGGREERPLP